MTSSYVAVIFAGGKSSRMGRDKALLPFGSFPTLAEFQQERLKPWFKKVYISAKENKFNFTCNWIADQRSESSPLVGLVSILDSIEEDEVFVLSVDAPFVDEKVIEKILSHDHDLLDAIVAKSPSGTQPLCGLYKKSILPFVNQQLEENNHKLQSVLDLAQTYYVNFNDDLPFMNLNHPHEYEKALRRD